MKWDSLFYFMHFMKIVMQFVAVQYQKSSYF